MSPAARPVDKRGDARPDRSDQCTEPRPLFPRSETDPPGALPPVVIQVRLQLLPLLVSPQQGLRQLSETGPPDLVREWVTKDGRARVRVSPRGDSNVNAVLQRFSKAVRRIAPDASGAPISIQEAGKTISWAFIEAGLLSLVAITALLLLILRSLREVAFVILLLQQMFREHRKAIEQSFGRRIGARQREPHRILIEFGNQDGFAVDDQQVPLRGRTCCNPAWRAGSSSAP